MSWLTKSDSKIGTRDDRSPDPETTRQKNREGGRRRWEYESKVMGESSKQTKICGTHQAVVAGAVCCSAHIIPEDLPICARVYVVLVMLSSPPLALFLRPNWPTIALFDSDKSPMLKSHRSYVL
jgi:hypothetical protein